MRASRFLFIGGIFSCALIIAVTHCPAAPATGPSIQTALEPLAKLSPGKTAGTFHLVYRGRADLAMPGECALLATISERNRPDIEAVRQDHAGEFKVEADLRPGSYNVTVSPAAKENADYWPSSRQTIHIDKAGHLYQPRLWLSGAPSVFVLDRRMKVAPADLAVADAKRPLLTWTPVGGATHYRGVYLSGMRAKNFDVEETQYRIGAGVDAGEACMWQIQALDGEGKVLARGKGNFLGHGTDAARVAELRAGPGKASPAAAPSKSYLGIQPLPTQIPKDAKTPLNYDDHTVHEVGRGFIPGILVVEVVPGSPAIDADLHPDDVILAVDGKRVPVATELNQGDHRAFAQQMSEMDPGRRITLTVRRFPNDVTLDATLAAYPGAGGAATRPAK